ncbi:Colicin V production protein [Rickettsiales bacterium Ac37b]|nr:Colicin V production protein [Rickettsiales bacterium Ac37b]
MPLDLTVFDYIIFTIIILSTLFALFKGFIKSCITFIAFIFSIILAYFIFPYLLILIKHYIKNPSGANISTGLMSYIIAAIFVAFVSNQLLKLTENIRGGALDRSLGLAFGFTRGCIISCIIFIIIVAISKALIPDSAEDTIFKNIKHSKSFLLLTTGSTALIETLPPKLSVKLNKTINNQLKKLTTISDTIALSELAKLIPPDILSNIDTTHLNILIDNNTSTQEKQQAIEDIINSYGKENTNNNPLTREQLKKILINYIKTYHKDPGSYSDKDNNDFNRLIQVLD